MRMPPEEIVLDLDATDDPRTTIGGTAARRSDNRHNMYSGITTYWAHEFLGIRP